MVTLAKTAFWAAMTWLVIVTAGVVQELPARIDARLEAVQAAAVNQIAAARLNLMAQVAAARKDIIAEVDKQASPILPAVIARVDKLQETVAAAADKLTVDVATVTDAVPPVLAQTDRSIAQLTPFVIGTVAAAKVTMGETAQTMKVVRDVAPKIAEQTLAGEKQLTGIATDVHTVTTQIAKPKTFLGKVWEGAKSLGGLARFF